MRGCAPCRVAPGQGGNPLDGADQTRCGYVGSAYVQSEYRVRVSIWQIAPAEGRREQVPKPSLVQQVNEEWTVVAEWIGKSLYRSLMQMADDLLSRPHQIGQHSLFVTLDALPMTSRRIIGPCDGGWRRAGGPHLYALMHVERLGLHREESGSVHLVNLTPGQAMEHALLVRGIQPTDNGKQDSGIMITLQEWKGRSIEALISVIKRDQNGIGWERGPFGKKSDELIERHNVEMIFAQQPQFLRKRLGCDDIARQFPSIDGVIHKHNALVPIIDRFFAATVNMGCCARRLTGRRRPVRTDPQYFRSGQQSTDKQSPTFHSYDAACALIGAKETAPRLPRKWTSGQICKDL